MCLCGVSARHGTLQDNRQRSSKAEAAKSVMSASRAPASLPYLSKLGISCSVACLDRSQVSRSTRVLHEAR
jgi:hypothetical protein